MTLRHPLTPLQSPLASQHRRAIAVGQAVLLGALLLRSMAAAAAGFGNLDLRSHFGQPLHAEIEILAAAGERVEESCYQLAPSRANDGDIPRINRAELRVHEAGGRQRLVLSTANPIREPLMLVSIRLACGIGMTKEFTLLFSPPETAAQAEALRRPKAGAVREVDDPKPDRSESQRGTVRLADDKGAVRTPRTMARALYPDQPRMQRRFADALIEANPGLDLFSDTPIPSTAAIVLPDMQRAADVGARPEKRSPTIVPAAPPPRLESPATTKGRSGKAPPDPAKARDGGMQFADRLMLSRGEAIEPPPPEDPPLRLALELASLRPGGGDNAPADTASERRRAVLRAEYRALAGFNARWPGSLIGDGEERRQSIRQSAAEFRQLADSLDRLDGPPAAPPTTTAATLPAPSAPARAEALPAASKPPTAQVADSLGFVPTVAALSMATLAVFGWVFVNRRREVAKRYSIDFPAIAADARTVADAEPGANVIHRPPPAPEDDWPDWTPAAPEPASAEAPQPAAEEPRPVVPSTPPAAESVPDEPVVDGMQVLVGLEEQAEDVIELADIMLAFGRFRGAANLLEDAIGERPTESLRPWTKLLDIYCENDMRAEFENAATRLNKNFNVAVQTWDEARHAAATGEPAPALSLADFPHIRRQIEALWGTVEGAQYLNRLIHDNRDGTRSGFRRHVAEEIVFLSDVLDERLKAAG